MNRASQTAASVPSGRVTLREVAVAAAVSTGTVSMVLNGDPRVAPATRDRVRAIAEQLGYVYNRGAAQLRKRRSGLIGFAVNDLSNPFHAEVAAGIEARLALEDRVLVLGNAGEEPDRQRVFLETLREHRVEGILLTPAIGLSPAVARRVREWGIPLVLVTRDLPRSGVDFAGHDDRRGFRALAEHLILRGHRRIAFVGGDQRTATQRERLRGYLDALAAAGLAGDPALVVAGRPTRTLGFCAVAALFGRRPPSAVMAFNDPVAFGVMLGLRERGLLPGRDCAVTGADDSPEAGLWRPALTSLALDAATLGARAADVLLARMRAPEAPRRRVLLPVRIELRASSSFDAPAPRRAAAGR